MREYLRLQRRVEELEDRLATVNEDQEEAVSNEMIFGLRINFSPIAAVRQIACLWRAPPSHADYQSYFKEVIGIGGQEESHVNVIVHKVNKALMAQGSPRAFRFSRSRVWRLDVGAGSKDLVGRARAEHFRGANTMSALLEKDRQAQWAERAEQGITRRRKSEWVIEQMRKALPLDHVHLANRLMDLHATAEGVKLAGYERVQGGGNSREGAMAARCDAMRALNGFDAAVRSRRAPTAHGASGRSHGARALPRRSVLASTHAAHTARPSAWFSSP